MLDQEVPGLSDQLRVLSPDQRRSVVAKAAQLVSQSIDDLEPALRSLIRFAVNGSVLSEEQIAEARAYAESSDDQYFTLKEGGADRIIWKKWFAKARLASALADAFGDISWERAADAVYELCFVEDDKLRVVNLVRSEIGSILREGT